MASSLSTTTTAGASQCLVGKLAEVVGAPEPAIRLLLTILAGYPISAFYRCAVVKQQAKVLHHIFFSLTGIGLCIFNYGFDTYHSLITIGVTYILVRLLRKTPGPLLGINFIFHMAYLLTGYYFTESGDYDILWTMPQCVLALRMIGFGFDVVDGRKPRDQLSKDQQETALYEIPTLLELSAYAYFPCAFLVGPQFPYRRYKSFINGEFMQYRSHLKAAIKRFSVGIMYLGIRQVGAMMLPDDYFLTDAYRNQPFIWRLIYLGLWGKLSLYKYISCWLLTEGALMSLGFSYAGKASNGEDDWFGCSNVKLMHLELGHTMQDYVLSFNVNTNHWVAQYIYKRLKFLNNRTISYAAALGFLAIWHGFHSGYYVAFVMEYMIVTIEKQIETMYIKSIIPAYGHILNSSLIYKCVMEIVLKTYNIIYMGWCLTAFIFLNYSRWMRVFSAVNYFGFYYIAFWFIVYQIYKHNSNALRRKTPEQQQFSNATTLSASLDNHVKSN